MATTDYTLGGARLFFNDGGQDGAAGNGYLDLGNIPNFSVERTIAEIEHFAYIASSSSRQKDLNIVTDIGMSFNFAVEERGLDPSGLISQLFMIHVISPPFCPSNSSLADPRILVSSPGTILFLVLAAEV